MILSKTTLGNHSGAKRIRRKPSHLEDEKWSINEERKRKGTNKGKKGKYPSRELKQVKTTEKIKAKVKKLQLKISALKRKPKDSSEDSDYVKYKDGESFGGRKEKKKAKSS